MKAWQEVADLIADSYRMTAPAQLRTGVGSTNS